jgi:hypothetical protein
MVTFVSFIETFMSTIVLAEFCCAIQTTRRPGVCSIVGLPRAVRVLLEDRSLPSQCPVVAGLAHSLEGAGVAGRLVITLAVMLIALARLVGHLPGDCHESASFRGEGHRLSYIFRLRQMSCYRTSIPATSSPQLRCSSQ